MCQNPNCKGCQTRESWRVGKDGKVFDTLPADVNDSIYAVLHRAWRKTDKLWGFLIEKGIYNNAELEAMNNEFTDLMGELNKVKYA